MSLTTQVTVIPTPHFATFCDLFVAKITTSLKIECAFALYWCPVCVHAWVCMCKWASDGIHQGSMKQTFVLKNLL